MPASRAPLPRASRIPPTSVIAMTQPTPQTQPTLSLADALLGGPGLDGYAYHATVYCVDCGRDIIRAVFARRGNASLPYPDAQTTDVLPQPVCFGEADTAQHCDDCGEYLYGPQPVRLSCPQCEMLSINGVACHETGCPNARARWDATLECWIRQWTCTECGAKVDDGEECCNAEPEQRECLKCGLAYDVDFGCECDGEPDGYDVACDERSYGDPHEVPLCPWCDGEDCAGGHKDGCAVIADDDDFMDDPTESRVITLDIPNLPADSGEACAIVCAAIEASDACATLRETEVFNAEYRVGSRRFVIAWGAGADVIELDV
jgi:hypothetical protein